MDSYGLINLAMLLAIIYPALGFVGQWIFGSPLQLGNTLIAPAGSATARVFVVIWFSVSSFLFLLRNNVKTRLPLPLPLLLLAGLISIGGSFILIGNQIGVPKTFLFALVAVSVLAFTSVFPFAVIDAFVVALVVALVVAFSFAVAFVNVAAYAFAFVGIFAVVLALTIIETKFGQRPTFRIFYLLLILLLVSVLILLLPEFGATDNISPTYLLLFFAIFPIFNALADFTSTGLTRYLLRRGLTKPIWFNALLDTLGGLSVFFLLGFALISDIHFVRPQDGTPLLDLATLFDQLQNNPSDFWWLALMLGSTLLPTLLHLMIGFATILIQYPAPLRNWTIRKLTSGGEGSDTDGWWGSAMVCGMISLSFWGPIIMFYYLFTINHSAVINGTIWVFSSYADLIQAL